MKELRGITNLILVPWPEGESIVQTPPISASRFRILLRPLPEAVAEEPEVELIWSALRPLPLSEILISNADLSRTIEMPARLAPECLRMLVRASCVARNKWWRICEERGCGGTCVGMSSSHWIPVIWKYS